MSSHHIVREKQEPALLLLGLANFSDELLGQLLEWSPTVVATPATAEKLNVYGTKVDYILTDGPDNGMQSDVKLLPLNGRAALEVAFNFFVLNGYSAVNVITDDVSLDDYLAYPAKINLVIFTGQHKIYPVHSGFCKWQSAGATLKILSSYNNMRVSGLERISENNYNTTRDGFFSLNFDVAFLFVAEPL